MLSIVIRDREVAASQSSPYTVLITNNATSTMAYKTIEEFMLQWHDTLTEMKVTTNSFIGQKSLTLMADWTEHTVYEYSDGIKAAIGAGARSCKLLSNGLVRPGAILVDAANKQTTFFRLNPNDKEYKKERSSTL